MEFGFPADFSVGRFCLNAMRLIYKHNVIHILYKQMWFISALRSLFSNWPASSSVSVLSSELNGQGSCPV